MTYIDSAALQAALTHAEKLDASSLTLESTLGRIVSSIQQLFDSCGAGLMLIDNNGALRYVAASNDDARTLEELQEKVGHGPCVDALLNDTVVTTDDVTTDERWPEIADGLVSTAVRAVMGVPVHISGTPIGSLNVYFASGHQWNDHELDVTERFGQVIENLISASLLAHSRDQTVTELKEALQTRIVIERAIGVVMGSEQLGAVDAFNRLRHTGRSQRRRVLEVARDLLDGKGPLPPTS